MKKTAMLLLSSVLVFPAHTFAAPGPGPGGAPGDGPGHRDAPRFLAPRPGHRVSILPELATAVAIGGITYWLANGIYYQKQGNEYVVVEKPPAPADSSLKTLDFGGKRYYVRDGHYYTRDIDGNYTEVPCPAGL
ncbi:TPA: hypothetical protein NOY28_004731 [Escherichia coli]|nr:DUF6515 family protein [Escherichia coli]EFG4415992.1 hypothetical protein [Escherichia coli]EIR8330587.1 hypothetical protein [Escherichia coli]ELL6198766.1 hypothetical protein [Escherichia coli]EMD6751680.1 hypothetical protein [Escherichia coli]EMD9634798.1 hypothetical protein [Escherichia coli]